MALLDDVKLSLRITHSVLDDDINDNIEAAKDELVRAGITSDFMFSDDPLIKRAIKTYCASFYAIDQNQAQAYMESFKYQLDNLRKTPKYSNSAERDEDV